MKVYQTSDVHLEFGNLTLSNDDNVEVLVLGGDIIVADRFKEQDPILEFSMSEEFHRFFKSASELFPHVIYIMGNHEFYNSDFATVPNHLRKCLSIYPNIHFLERESIKIGDVTFIGGTMWSDCNKSDPQTLMHLKYAMNDFRIVKNSNNYIMQKVPAYKKNEDGTLAKDDLGYNIPDGYKRKKKPATFTPQDSVLEHDKFLGYLKNVVEGKYDEKFFVCTHHAPSRLSTHPKYKHDILMNGAYSSELFDFVADNPQIKVWTHGHTHEDFDYMIGSTRVVCNPRGYKGYENRTTDYKLKLIEV